MYRHFTQQCFIPLWQVWADIECNVHVALPKWPINKFNPIPTDLYHVIIVYGLIQPMAGRNRVNASPAHFYYTLWKYNYGLSTTIQTHCSSPGLYPNYSNLVVSYSLSNCYCNTSLDDSNYGLLEYDFASLLVFQIPPYKGGIFFL